MSPPRKQQESKPEEQPTRVPPHNVEAEEHVIGSMLISATAIEAVSEILSPADFYRPSHGRMYEVMVEMAHAGTAVDAITLANRLEELAQLKSVGGKDRIREIATLVPASTNAKHWAVIVRDTAVVRRLAEAGYITLNDAMAREKDTPTLVEEAESRIFDLTKHYTRTEAAPIGDTLAATFTELEDLYAAGGRKVTGTATGFGHLDALTSGLQPGNLIILAGRPSMGKTALALMFASNVALRQELPVLVFSLEMSRSELERRLLSAEADVEAMKIHRGVLNREEWGRLVNATSKLMPAPILIDDSNGLRVTELRAKARRIKMRNPDLALVVVDYLQLMSANTTSENRVQEVSQISRMLKVLAGDLDVPVVALSQLSRQVEQRHDKRPMLSDLRDSGSLEQDGDVVVFVYRDEYYHPEDTDQEGIAEIIVAKQRNGPTGTVKLSFVKRFAKFSTLAVARAEGE